MLTLRKKDVKKISKNVLLYSGALTIMIIAVLFILSLNFDYLFNAFHKTFFTGNWEFPEDSLLIQLFPFGFFKNYFLRILINSIIFSIIFILAGFCIKHRDGIR